MRTLSPKIYEKFNSNEKKNNKDLPRQKYITVLWRCSEVTYAQVDLITHVNV